eukprot:m51a1_g9659 hypothetical protein (712) ;mRNA; r:1210015-1218120
MSAASCPVLPAECERALSAAWVLRQSVVPRMVDAGDLCSLAMSFAAALSAPCFLRIALHCSTPNVSPAEALLLHLATRQTAAPLGQLVRRCPGLGVALCMPSCVLSRVFSAASAAPLVPFDNLRLLATAFLDDLPPGALQRASGEALVRACRTGGPRAALFARELSVAPFSAHTGSQRSLEAALRAACSSGSAEAVCVLGAAPYGLGRKHALARDAGPRLCAFDCACQSGCLGVVEALARPPFGLCHRDMVVTHYSALKYACTAGCADIVSRLSRPPFCLRQQDAIKCDALVDGCCSVAVLDVLASDPYNLNGDHALFGDGDLCSLALSFAAALAAPCFRRASLLLPWQPYVLPVSHPDHVFFWSVELNLEDVVLSSGLWGRVTTARSPLEALVLHLCSLPTAGPLRELVRRCPGLCSALCCPTRELYRREWLRFVLSRVFAAASAAPQAAFDNFRFLASLPGIPGDVAKAAGQGALVGACRAGGARAAHFARELEYKPFRAHKVLRMSLVDALRMACLSGSAEAVGVLGSAPYGLGHEQAAFRSEQRWATAFYCACQSGCVDVVDALGRPPYSICQKDLVKEDCEALQLACAWGHADIVLRLSLPPFSMGRSQVLHWGLIKRGCRSVAMLDVLASAYNITGKDIRGEDALSSACRCRDAGPLLLDALAEPPYSLTREDIPLGTLLSAACYKGRQDIVRRLAQAPYTAILP